MSVNSNPSYLLAKLKMELDDLKTQIENDKNPQYEKASTLKWIETNKAELEHIESQVRQVHNKINALEKSKEDIAYYVKTGKLPNFNYDVKPTSPIP